MLFRTIRSTEVIMANKGATQVFASEAESARAFMVDVRRATVAQIRQRVPRKTLSLLLEYQAVIDCLDQIIKDEENSHR